MAKKNTNKNKSKGLQQHSATYEIHHKTTWDVLKGSPVVKTWHVDLEFQKQCFIKQFRNSGSAPSHIMACQHRGTRGWPVQGNYQRLHGCSKVNHMCSNRFWYAFRTTWYDTASNCGRITVGYCNALTVKGFELILPTCTWQIMGFWRDTTRVPNLNRLPATAWFVQKTHTSADPQRQFGKPMNKCSHWSREDVGHRTSSTLFLVLPP